MEVYKQNLEILKRRYPQLYNRLFKLEQEEPRFTVEESKLKDHPTIAAVDDQGKFYLYSLYNPLEEAKRVMSTINLNKISSLWVMGVGLGYQVMELLNVRHQGLITVFVESDPNLFKLFLHTSVAAKALEWPYFYFTTGPREWIERDLEAVLQTKVHFQLGMTHILLSPGFARYDKVNYRELSDKIINYSRYRFTHLGNSIEDTLDGLRNTFYNFRVLCNSPGIHQLEDKYQGVPAILVSAGPSLDKNIDLLGEIQGKALIISTDTTFPVLLKKNIVPNLVTSVERIPEVYHRFYEKTDIPRDTWLAALNVADPRVFECFPGRNLLAVRATEPLSRWIDHITDNKGGLITGLSTSHLALSVAYMLGCSPIIMIGQDLALGEDDRYYVSGTNSNGKEDLSEEVWVDNYEGKKIKSTKWLKTYLEWFEKFINSEIKLRRPDIQIIDATEGGAYIQGTQVMTLREVLDLYCIDRQPFTPVIEAIDDPQIVSVDKILTEIRGFKNDIEKILDLVEDTEDLISEVKKESSGELKKIALRAQEMINELLLQITFKGRVSFLLQAIITTIMIRLSSTGQLENDEEINSFLKYVDYFLNELKQAGEISLYTMDQIIRGIKKEAA